jgi:hypothetical protein
MEPTTATLTPFDEFTDPLLIPGIGRMSRKRERQHALSGWKETAIPEMLLH